METNNTEELPIFPAEAPEIFKDGQQARVLMSSTLAQLASVVDIDANRQSEPTPCDGFTVAELQRHVLAWLQFFAAALTDPSGTAPRLDPETWSVPQGADLAAIVEDSSTLITDAIDRGVATELVVMSQARMQGDAVVAMALGEYLIHGWDLAVSTGREWAQDHTAAEPALAFLHTTVAPEYRGPESGFFGEEVAVSPAASAFQRLLGFAGRDIGWGETS